MFFWSIEGALYPCYIHCFQEDNALKTKQHYDDLWAAKGNDKGVSLFKSKSMLSVMCLNVWSLRVHCGWNMFTYTNLNTAYNSPLLNHKHTWPLHSIMCHHYLLQFDLCLMSQMYRMRWNEQHTDQNDPKTKVCIVKMPGCWFNKVTVPRRLNIGDH